jgi:hypothetical protein
LRPLNITHKPLNARSFCQGFCQDKFWKTGFLWFYTFHSFFQITVVLKLWFKSGLFANFVGRNSVEDAMSLHRNSFYIIRVYRMICTLPQKPKSMFFKVSYQITPFGRHPEPLLELAQSGPHLSVSPFSVAYKPRAFH